MILKFKKYLRIVWTTKNWPTVLIIVFSLHKSCEAVFRGGLRFKVSSGNLEQYMSHVNFIRCFPDGKIFEDKVEIIYGGRAISFYFGDWGPNIISEIYYDDPYREIVKDQDIIGKQVVDIGAAVGDTAIYFILRGAKEVIAYEPHQSSYELAVKNIEVNNFSDKCKVINAAIGKEAGSIIIDSKSYKMFGSSFEDHNKGEVIPVKTLHNIVQEHQINDALLKIDCEGFEYDIILSAPNEILSRFNFILIEYHFGIQGLKSKLEEANFKVTFTNPKFLRRVGYPDMQRGYLTALRIIK